MRVVYTLLFSLLISCLPVQANEPLTESKPATSSKPAILWSFDEGKGIVSASADDGPSIKILGASWVKGIEGHGISMDGEITYLSCSDAKLPDTFPSKYNGKEGDFTLACWVRTRQDRHRHPLIVKQGNLQRGFMLTVERSNRVAIQLYADQELHTDLESGERLKPRTWHHVAVTYRFAGNGKSELKLYLDGNQEGVSTNAVGPPASNSLPLEVGRIEWSRAYSRYLAGRIDDVRFYDRALSTEEIGALAHSAKNSVVVEE